MTERPDQSPAIAAAIIVQDGRVLLVRRRVSEGKLSWQFPAGAIEPGESATDAAVRESSEEVGLAVQAVQVLGDRIHPSTGRKMVYVACKVATGEAYVADQDELAEIEWCDRNAVATHVPFPLFEPVQAYLDSSMR